jgi:hypothetical protein
MAKARKEGPPKGRISMNIEEIIAEIDAYPSKRGIDPTLWNSMSYPQKCLYLAKKELEAADSLALEDED